MITSLSKEIDDFWTAYGKERAAEEATRRAIREGLEAKGITLAALAKAAGMTPSKVRKQIAVGRHVYPPARAIVEAARALGII